MKTPIKAFLIASAFALSVSAYAQEGENPTQEGKVIQPPAEIATRAHVSTEHFSGRGGIGNFNNPFSGIARDFFRFKDVMNPTRAIDGKRTEELANEGIQRLKEKEREKEREKQQREREQQKEREQQRERERHGDRRP